MFSRLFLVLKCFISVCLSFDVIIFMIQAILTGTYVTEESHLELLSENVRRSFSRSQVKSVPASGEKKSAKDGPQAEKFIADSPCTYQGSTQ